MNPKRSTAGAALADKASGRGISSRHNEGRTAKVLVAPILTEAATQVTHKRNQVLFKVLREATKPEIKAAVELMFKVEVQRLAVNVKGKPKRFGRPKHRVLKPALVSMRIASEDLDAAVQHVAA